MDKYVHTHAIGALHLILLKATNLSRNPGEADRKCQYLAINSSWGGKEKFQSWMRNPSSSFAFCLMTISSSRVALCEEGTRERLEWAESIRPESREIDVMETGDVWKACDLWMMLIKTRSEAGFKWTQVPVMPMLKLRKPYLVVTYFWRHLSWWGPTVSGLSMPTSFLPSTPAMIQHPSPPEWGAGEIPWMYSQPSLSCAVARH